MTRDGVFFVLRVLRALARDLRVPARRPTPSVIAWVMTPPPPREGAREPERGGAEERGEIDVGASAAEYQRRPSLCRPELLIACPFVGSKKKDGGLASTSVFDYPARWRPHCSRVMRWAIA